MFFFDGKTWKILTSPRITIYALRKYQGGAFAEPTLKKKVRVNDWTPESEMPTGLPAGIIESTLLLPMFATVAFRCNELKGAQCALSMRQRLDRCTDSEPIIKTADSMASGFARAIDMAQSA
jgi:hypothetical protein